LLKLGALAVALVVLFAACAQPTEESSSGSNKDTIIRLYLDRPDKQTLDVGDSFQLRVGQQLLVPARLVTETHTFTTTGSNTAASGNAYPAGTYTISRKVWRPNTRAAGTGEGGTANVSYVRKDRLRTGVSPTQADWFGTLGTAYGTLVSAASAAGTGIYTGVVTGGPAFVGTDTLANVDLVSDVDKFEIYEAEDFAFTGGEVFLGADLVSSDWGITSSANEYFSFIVGRIPTQKYYETGVVTITDGTSDQQHIAGPLTVTGGVPKVVTTDSQYYVDLVLVNRTPAAKEYGATLKGSVSAYIELEILTGASANVPSGVTAYGEAALGGMPADWFFMYTKDKHGFNTWNGGEGKWNENNANIKKVSLKPGINELRLSYFSKGEGDVEF
jgi:hypothetical protein